MEDATYLHFDYAYKSNPFLKTFFRFSRKETGFKTSISAPNPNKTEHNS